MFKFFTKKKVEPVHLSPGDTVALTYVGRDGTKHKVDYAITEHATFDTMAVGEIENELGFVSGIVGIIGNE